MVIRGSYSLSYTPDGVQSNLRIANKLRQDIIKILNSIKNKIKRWISIYFPEFSLIYSSIYSKSGSHFARLEISLLIDDLEYKQEQLNKITLQIEELCEEIPEVKEIAEIKGVGFLTAASFVAEIGDIRRFNSPKQIQKYVGLTLRENSSRKHKGITRISKRGRRRLRTLLFRVSIPLVGKNKEFSKIYTNYLNPLKKKQALITICCKIIRIFYAILSKRIKYNEKKMIEDIENNISIAA